MVRRAIALSLLGTVTLLIANLFVASVYVASSGSMEPTIPGGAPVIAERLTLALGRLERGEIVVFADPRDPGATPLMKRIVGLPGERIEIRAGVVLRDGVELDEPYLAAGTETVPNENEPARFDLGPDELLVLGDHRSGSIDSRAFGPIALSAVSARVLVVLPFLARGGRR